MRSEIKVSVKDGDDLDLRMKLEKKEDGERFRLTLNTELTRNPGISQSAAHFASHHIQKKCPFDCCKKYEEYTEVSFFIFIIYCFFFFVHVNAFLPRPPRPPLTFVLNFFFLFNIFLFFSFSFFLLLFFSLFTQRDTAINPLSVSVHRVHHSKPKKASIPPSLCCPICWMPCIKCFFCCSFCKVSAIDQTIHEVYLHHATKTTDIASSPNSEFQKLLRIWCMTGVCGGHMFQSRKIKRGCVYIFLWFLVALMSVVAVTFAGFIPPGCDQRRMDSSSSSSSMIVDSAFDTVDLSANLNASVMDTDMFCEAWLAEKQQGENMASGFISKGVHDDLMFLDHIRDGSKVPHAGRRLPTEYTGIASRSCAENGLIAATNSDECKTAAESMGASDTTPRVISSDKYPPGCYLEAITTSTRVLIFNDYSSGVDCSRDQQCFCRIGSTGSGNSGSGNSGSDGAKITFQGITESKCSKTHDPPLRLIGNSDECKTAAEAFKINFKLPIVTTNTAQDPVGCYVTPATSGGVSYYDLKFNVYGDSGAQCSRTNQCLCAVDGMPGNSGSGNSGSNNGGSASASSCTSQETSDMMECHRTWQDKWGTSSSNPDFSDYCEMYQEYFGCMPTCYCNDNVKAVEAQKESIRSAVGSNCALNCKSTTVKAAADGDDSSAAATGGSASDSSESNNYNAGTGSNNRAASKDYFKVTSGVSFFFFFCFESRPVEYYFFLTISNKVNFFSSYLFFSSLAQSPMTVNVSKVQLEVVRILNVPLK